MTNLPEAPIESGPRYYYYNRVDGKTAKISWFHLAASQQQAAGGLQRPDQAETKPQADDLSQKGVVIHAEPENLQDTPKSEVIVDVAGIQPGYANFCRVTATLEEVLLDFGFNVQPFATETTIRRHEQTFGAIELDVRRRTKTFQQRQQGGDFRK
jgi:hypothetical protein